MGGKGGFGKGKGSAKGGSSTSPSPQALLQQAIVPLLTFMTSMGQQPTSSIPDQPAKGQSKGKKSVRPKEATAEQFQNGRKGWQDHGVHQWGIRCKDLEIPGAKRAKAQWWQYGDLRCPHPGCGSECNRPWNTHCAACNKNSFR